MDAPQTRQTHVRKVAQRQQRPKKQKGLGKGLLSKLLVACVVLVALGLLTASGFAFAWLQDLPEYEDASLYNSTHKTEIYATDRTTLLAELYIENRQPVSWDDIAQYVKDGSVATEDERFYHHGGFDPIGIARAAFVSLSGKGKEGASTITQQFVRNTVLLDEMHDITLKRKLREIFIATKLEEKFSKDEILLMYLNTINYGSGAYGIEAAAQTYFSKSAKDLNLVEAATLVGIPQSPTANNPLEFPEASQERRNLVLSRMLKNGYITQEEYDQAVNTPLADTLKPKPADTRNGLYKYPYFTSYVRKILLEKYDKNQVFKGGLKVYTSIDPATQDAALAAAQKKEKSIPADLEVALTAIDPSTGFIRAMVGGRDYYKDEYNLATQAQRQAGSSFKTFTLVAALEDGMSPKTRIDCSSPVTIDGWRVENYNGANYGTRTLEGAFAISSNTAFARLVTYLTPERVIETAKRMGIETSLESVPSLTLGTQNVTTKEMAQAFATIANGGIARTASAIEEIVDLKGRTIYRADTKGVRALSPEVAYAASKVMEGVITHGTGRAAALKNGQVVAGKTGTTENWRDSYFCGITPQMSVAIWLGARQERTMPTYISATSVFSDFMNKVLEGKPKVDFKKEADPKYVDQSDAKLHIGRALPEVDERKLSQGVGTEDIASTDIPSDDREGSTTSTNATTSNRSEGANNQNNGQAATGTTQGSNTASSDTAPQNPQNQQKPDKKKKQT